MLITRVYTKHNFNWSNLSALPVRSSQQSILNSLSSGLHCSLITAVYPSKNFAPETTRSWNYSLLKLLAHHSSRCWKYSLAIIALAPIYSLCKLFARSLTAVHLTSSSPYSRPLVFASDRVAFTRSSFSPEKTQTFERHSTSPGLLADPLLGFTPHRRSKQTERLPLVLTSDRPQVFDPTLTLSSLN